MDSQPTFLGSPLLLFNGNGDILYASERAAAALGLIQKSSGWNFPEEVAEWNRNALRELAAGADSSQSKFLKSPQNGDIPIATIPMPQGEGGIWIAELQCGSDLLELFHRIVALYNEQVSAGEKYSRLAEMLRERLGAQAVLIHTAEYAHGKLRLSAFSITQMSPEILQLRDMVSEVKFGQGLLSKVIAGRRPVVSEDLPSDPEKLPWLDPELLRKGNLNSYIGIPLQVRGELPGVLQMVFSSPERLHCARPALEALMPLVSRFVYEMEVTVRRSEKFQRQLAFLNRLPLLIQQSDSFEEVFRKTAKFAVELLNYWDIGVYRYVPEKDLLRLMAIAGEWKEKFPEDYEQPVSVGIMGWTARNRKTRYVPDIHKEPLYHQPFDIQAGSELAVPISLGDRLFGVINLEAPELDAFDQFDIDYLTAVGKLLAIYLDYSWHLKQQEERLNITTFLSEASFLLHQHIGRRDLAENFVRFLQKKLNVFYVSFYRYHPDLNKLEKVAQSGGKRSPRPIGSFWPAGSGALGKVVQTRKFVYFPDVSIRPEGYIPVTEEEYGSELCLPVQVGKQIYGVVNVESEREHEFNGNLIATLQASVDHFAIAFHNSMLLETIRAQKRRLDAVLSSMTDGILLVQDDGRVAPLNRAARRILVRWTGKATARSLDQLPFAKKLLGLLQENSENDPAFGFEYSDGRGNFWLISIVSLGRHEQGREHMILLRDISREKREEESRVQNERNKMAMEMAGSIAHELNQPLTGILGYCSLLLEDLEPDSELAKDIRLIEEQATRISELVKKFQSVVRVKTRSYPGGTRIVDWEDSEVKE